MDIRELRPDRFGDNRVLLHDKKLGVVLNANCESGAYDLATRETPRPTRELEFSLLVDDSQNR